MNIQETNSHFLPPEARVIEPESQEHSQSPIGAWSFAIAWLIVSASNLAKQINSGNHSLPIRKWFIILSAISLSLVFVRLGYTNGSAFVGRLNRRALIRFARITATASLIWPLTYAFASYLAFLIYLGPSLFTEFLQTPPFGGIVRLFPRLIGWYVLPSMLLGLVLLRLHVYFFKQHDVEA